MSERCLLIVLALLSDKLFAGFIDSSPEVSRETSWRGDGVNADNHSYAEESDETDPMQVDAQSFQDGGSWDTKGTTSLSDESTSRTILPFGFEMIAVLMGKAFLVALISILVTAAMGLKTGKYFYDHSPISGDFADPSRYPYASYHDDHQSTTATATATHFGFDPNSGYYSGYFANSNPDPNTGQWLDLTSYPFVSARRNQQNNDGNPYRSSYGN